ncbi:hypothetical protein [Ekhidna sp.]
MIRLLSITISLLAITLFLSGLSSAYTGELWAGQYMAIMIILITIIPATIIILLSELFIWIKESKRKPIMLTRVMLTIVLASSTVVFVIQYFRTGRVDIEDQIWIPIALVVFSIIEPQIEKKIRTI